jgi:hypothetical protein
MTARQAVASRAEERMAGPGKSRAGHPARALSRRVWGRAPAGGGARSAGGGLSMG